MKTTSLVLLLLITSATKLTAQKLGESFAGQHTTQNISLERLKSATLVEELLDNFPKADWCIVQCKISIAGKDVKYREYSLRNDSIPADKSGEMFTVPIGTKIYVEHIKSQTLRNTEGSIRQMAPYSLTVTE